MPPNHNGLCKAVPILIEARTGKFEYGRKANSNKVGFRRIRCDAIHSESSSRCGTNLSNEFGGSFFSRLHESSPPTEGRGCRHCFCRSAVQPGKRIRKEHQRQNPGSRIPKLVQVMAGPMC